MRHRLYSTHQTICATPWPILTGADVAAAAIVEDLSLETSLVLQSARDVSGILLCSTTESELTLASYSTWAAAHKCEVVSARGSSSVSIECSLGLAFRCLGRSACMKGRCRRACRTTFVGRDIERRITFVRRTSCYRPSGFVLSAVS